MIWSIPGDEGPLETNSLRCRCSSDSVNGFSRFCLSSDERRVGKHSVKELSDDDVLVFSVRMWLLVNSC